MNLFTNVFNVKYLRGLKKKIDITGVTLKNVVPIVPLRGNGMELSWLFPVV